MAQLYICQYQGLNFKKKLFSMMVLPYGTPYLLKLDYVLI